MKVEATVLAAAKAELAGAGELTVDARHPSELRAQFTRALDAAIDAALREGAEHVMIGAVAIPLGIAMAGRASCKAGERAGLGRGRAAHPEEGKAAQGEAAQSGSSPKRERVAAGQRSVAVAEDDAAKEASARLGKRAPLAPSTMKRRMQAKI